MNTAQILSQKSLMLVFTYAKAGLGHLRVTHALDSGLPDEVVPVLLGSQDDSISVIHRLTSVNTLGRSVMEWFQRGLPEEIFTILYRRFLRSHTSTLYKQVLTLLEQRVDMVDTVLIVATHFGLAHQIAAIKDKLQQETKVRIILIVQVTDDTPQHIWYVPGADLTFVPSYKTMERLTEYGRMLELPKIKMEVLPYPISPYLGELLGVEKFNNRLRQVSLDSESEIHLCMPVSGAAVGTQFASHLISGLRQKSSRFVFHVICKAAPFTTSFISEMVTKNYVRLSVSTHGREVVAYYEDLYEKKVISLEMTKPSEQAFKALFNPKQKGGAILLFAKPVGLQEYDNLDFLRRHGLIPSYRQQRYLWDRAQKDLPPYDMEGREVFADSKHWRGMVLPYGSKDASKYIWWCLKHSFLANMTENYTGGHWPKSEDELGYDGVRRFWNRVAEFVEETKV